MKKTTKDAKAYGIKAYGEKTYSVKKYTEISRTGNIVFNIIMIIFAILCIYPLLLVFAVSITDEKAISLYGYHLIPKKVSFYAYKYVLQDYMVIGRAYFTTILVTTVGSFISVIVMSMFAYPLSRKYFKYRNKFSFFVYFTMLFNGGLVPWYMVYARFLHLKNSYWALIIPALVSPMYVLIMRTFFTNTIPDEIVEAAKIDGAGEFYTFVKIIVPLSKPVIATVSLFNILSYWNDWYLPLLFITDEKKYTLQYLLYKVESSIQYLSNSSQNFGNVSEILSKIPSQSARMAMAIVAIGPIIFAYPFFQKYFVEGLTIGSVKG